MSIMQSFIRLIMQTECDKVIFAATAKKLFQDFKIKLLKLDKKHSIYFADDTIQKDSIDLLMFHCPSADCTVLCASGWTELAAHVKKQHNRFLW
jgi:hypothetical protein